MSISIGNRLFLGFGAVTLVLIALGFYAISQIGAAREATDAIVARDLKLAQRIDDLGNKARVIGNLRRNATIDTLIRARASSGQSVTAPIEPAEDVASAWRRTADEIEATLAGIVKSALEYRTNAISEQRALAWAGLSETATEATGLFRAVRVNAEAFFTAVAARDVDAVIARNAELNLKQANLLRTIDRTRGMLDDSILSGQRTVSSIQEHSRSSIMLTLGAAVLLSLIIAALIRRAVVQPVLEIMSFVERVGDGDLTGRMATAGRDEVGRLGRALNAMVGGLADLARTNRAATADLNAAAAEIRASAQEQAASVEEQFAAVQETAATVDQITHSGSQITKRASDVIASAQSSAQSARAGLRAANDAAKAMELIGEQGEAVAGNIVSLSEKTQAIGEIIANVNDISERTHLLALNAAIEAAAAGESGRSFAIVASEMKLLADQAKSATAQVRTILSEIQRGINASVMLTEEAVKRAGAGKTRSDSTVRTIEEMAARAEESVQTFQQIVASTNQQQLGIEQVMGALQNIRLASQQTAAGTREVEMASANLTELAQGLMTLAERYRL